MYDGSLYLNYDVFIPDKCLHFMFSISDISLKIISYITIKRR